MQNLYEETSLNHTADLIVHGGSGTATRTAARTATRIPLNRCSTARQEPPGCATVLTDAHLLIGSSHRRSTALFDSACCSETVTV